MNPVRVNDSIVIQDLADLAELCRVAGAADSTIISSCDKVIVYYRDPQTNGVHDEDFVDELHIEHQKKARVLIVVFPVSCSPNIHPTNDETD
jgi:hypothetical protein